MAFDPDAYLAQKSGSTSFDPDAYLQQKQSAQPQQSGFQKFMAAAKVPEQMSRKGLQELQNLVPSPEPTGNLPMDIVKGTPSILAQSALATAKKVAPNFVSPLGLAGMAAGPALEAVKPLTSAARGVLFDAGEGLSMPAKAKGALEAAYQDPSILLAKKSAATPLYEAAKSSADEAANLFKRVPENKDIISKAIDYLDKGGTLEPTEAHTVRKAIDAVRGSKAFNTEVLDNLRKEVDVMAKASPDIAAADPLFKRGAQGEALRKIFPQNLRGGTSRFSVGVGTALANMGLPGKIASVGLSPAIWGGAASAAGLAARNPALLGAFANWLKYMGTDTEDKQ